MNRRQLQERVENAWRAFRDSCSGLTDSEMTEPGVTGEWSVKDIVAHVSTWEDEALKVVPLVLRGEAPPRYSVTHGGINAFNAQMTARKSSSTLSDVLREGEETHKRLVALIESLPEEQLSRETRVRRRLRLDTYGHYPKHTNAIRTWREKRTATS